MSAYGTFGGDLRLNHPLIRPHITTRTYNALYNAFGKDGFAPTVREVTSMDNKKLMCVKNFGKKCLDDIKNLREVMETGEQYGNWFDRNWNFGECVR